MPDQKVFDRVVPHSLEAERSVLGACIVDREALNEVMEILEAGHFYDLNHRAVFEAIWEMSTLDKPVDPLTLMEELSKRGISEKVGGQAFIAGLVEGVPTTANAGYHANIVRDKAIHRSLIQTGNDLVRLGYSEDREVREILEEAEQAVFAISQDRNRQTYRSIGDVLPPAFQKIEEQYHSSDQEVSGIQTPFSDFNRLTGGFQAGSLNIIAARPSMGKTALAINFAQYLGVKESPKPVLIFSLEMSAEQLVQRMLGSEAMVNIHDLRTGNIADQDWQHLTNGAGRLARAPIYIDDSSMLSTLEFRARCRRFKAKHQDLGLVVVDYLQLMSFHRRIDSKQQEVAEISRVLKGVAREVDVPVVALSQLSRAVEQRNEKRPQLSDLRDSGAIEQDADMVLLLYREGYYNPDPDSDDTSEIIIAKHRNGPTGVINLIFRKEYTRFESALSGHYPGM
jgi:replicative DNA helicase